MSTLLTSELEAINTMLSTIGEAPVNRIEDSGNVDVAIARNVLTEVSRQVQSQGWHWNTESGVILTPTFPLPGTIYVPVNTLSVDADDEQIDVVLRGNRLRDRASHSFLFETDIAVTLKLFLAFDEIPQIARHYITVRAARVFQDRVVGSETLSGFNEKDETRALAALKNDEAESADYNILRNTSVMRIMNRTV